MDTGNDFFLALEISLEHDYHSETEAAIAGYSHFVTLYYAYVNQKIIEMPAAVSICWQMLITNIANRITELEGKLEKNSLTEEYEESMNRVKHMCTEVTDCNFESLHGQNEIKLILFRDVIYPRIKQVAYENKKRVQKILFHGPPGTGKSMFCKALVGQLCLNTGKMYKMIYVTPSSILSKWSGESEKGIRAIFKLATCNKPCVIFFDEIDAITQSRFSSTLDVTSHRVLSEFLVCVSSMQNADDILLVAATNCIDLIDPAMLRRFCKIISFTHPDSNNRFFILKGYLHKECVNFSETELKAFSEKVEFSDWSANDLVSLCEEASRKPMNKNADNLFNHGIDRLLIESDTNHSNMDITLDMLTIADLTHVFNEMVLRKTSGTKSENNL